MLPAFWKHSGWWLGPWFLSTWASLLVFSHSLCPRASIPSELDKGCKVSYELALEDWERHFYWWNQPLRAARILSREEKLDYLCWEKSMDLCKIPHMDLGRGGGGGWISSRVGIFQVSCVREIKTRVYSQILRVDYNDKLWNLIE